MRTILSQGQNQSSTTSLNMEHYDESKDDPSTQTIFFTAFDVLLIIIITAILIAKFRP
jgi:hypothetical protein